MKTALLICAALYFAGNAGAQTTWYEIATGTDKKLNTVNFPSQQVGYIGGNDSVLLKTTNGGETWTEVNYTGVTFMPGGEHILNLKFVSETTGYMAVGPYSGVYKTTNGGSTWTQVTPAGNLCFNEGLFFFDEMNGFLGGAGCFQGETIEKMTAGVLATTTINTATWDAANMVVDIDFLDTDFGLAASVSGYILRTTDGGSTWDTIPTGLNPNVPLTSVAIIDDTLAYAGYNDLGAGFGLLRTTDGGLTWGQDMNSATFYYPAWLCLHEAVNGKVYAGTQPSTVGGGVIFESPETEMDVWNFYDVAQPINDLSSYADSVVFGVGDSGLVVVNHLPGNLSVADEENTFGKLDVYPNPVSNELTIQIPAGVEPGETVITLVSISGQVLQVIDQPVDNRIDVSFLAPGVYFVSLRANGTTSTARIIKE